MSNMEKVAAIVRHPAVHNGVIDTLMRGGIPQLSPLGYDRRGKPFYPILGAAEDDGGSSEGSSGNNGQNGSGSAGDSGSGSTDSGSSGAGGTGSGPAGDDGNSGANDGGSDDDSDGKNSDDIRDPDKKRLHDEAAKERRLKAKAIKDLEEANKKIREFEDKDSTELDKAKRDAGEATTRVEKLSGTNRKLSLKIAVLENSKYKWHDVNDAIANADLADVEIDDDGNVTGLEDALKALAKKKPYLLAGNESGGNGTGSSGSTVGSGGRGTTEEQRDNRIKSKFRF